MSQSGSASPPSRASNTPRRRPEIPHSKTDTFMEQSHLNLHTRSRSTSQISDFSLSSLDGDSTPTQRTNSMPLPLPTTEMPSTPQQTPAPTGNWEQQFFDQAFMSEIQGFEGGTVDFLYNAGAASMFASPAYPPSSNYSPAMSFSSEGSIDGLENGHIDPKLTTDYDDLFNTHIPFNHGNDLCLTPPQFEFSTSFPSIVI
jgi:hypothetical protein